MEYQIKIWIETGKPITLAQLESQGFTSFEQYVRALQRESQQGYKNNGKRREEGDHLPLLQLGTLNAGTGEKTVAFTYAGYDDLPQVGDRVAHENIELLILE